MRRSATQAATDRQGDGFDHVALGRLTWLGLSLATFGWIGLVSEIVIVDAMPNKIPRAITPPLHADIVNVVICLIASGFALAIIGALQSGFGALNRFFEAVLIRSSQRPTATPVHTETEMASSNGRRPYRILPDGSVEVETIVGTRRFVSLEEARDFI